jgi:hypothetical protein
MDIPAKYGFQLLENAGADLVPAPSKPPDVNDPAAKPACCPQWPNACTAPKTCEGMPAP